MREIYIEMQEKMVRARSARPYEITYAKKLHPIYIGNMEMIKHMFSANKLLPHINDVNIIAIRK